MSTDPTTTSQVQAYRFVLRRMESALVRKDAVMLHEPMRQHLRATAVGLVLGLLGLAAFFVVGKFRLANEAGAKEIVLYMSTYEQTAARLRPRHLLLAEAAPSPR